MSDNFTCVACLKRHGADDVGKAGQSGGGQPYYVCKVCAYGHSNRMDRRDAPRREVCAARCWR